MSMGSVAVQGQISAVLDYVEIDTTQCGSLGVRITGTFSQTLTAEATLDGVNWDLAPMSTVAASPAVVTGATAPGIWQASTAGFRRFRINCPVTYVSGTAVVTLSPSLGPLQGPTGAAGPGGGVTVADGADVAEGATTDAAVTAGAAGTVSAKLRAISRDIATLVAGVKDNGPAWTSVHGVSGVPFTSADQHSAVASVTDAPTSGQKLVITDLFVSVDTAMSVTFKCETSGAVIAGPFYMPANSTHQFTPRSKAWKLATADKKLQVITSVVGNVMVDTFYFSET